MKTGFSLIIMVSIMVSCTGNHQSLEQKHPPISINGTWKLISGTTIQNGDTTVTYYTKNLSFIKIINDSHFAFLNHDLTKGKDSTAAFSAGGGRYTLKDNLYTEHLEYCSDRQWEANDFTFSVSVKNDTLIQQGIEKVENAGINQINTEKYIRLKN